MPDETLDVELYETQEGRCPFQEWLKGLRDVQARARVLQRLNRVRLGNLGDHHGVGGGVSELRFTIGPGYRVYFGRSGNKLIILLCGGDKASQQRDIERAKEYWTDYTGGSDG